MADLLVTGRDILVAISICSAGLVVFLLFSLLNRRKSVLSPEPTHELARLAQEVANLRQRVERLEGTVAHSAEVADAAAVDPIYTAALQLIRQGLHSGEVADRLGLARAEVDLIAVLHREALGRSP
jgi:hypothetical protein